MTEENIKKIYIFIDVNVRVTVEKYKNTTKYGGDSTFYVCIF